MVLKIPKREIIDKKELVLNEIIKDNKIYQKDIAKKLGFTIGEVNYALKKLKEENRVKHIGNSKDGNWEFLEV